MVFDVINFKIVQIENVSKHAEGGSIIVMVGDFVFV